MGSEQFIHLHTHSIHSLLDGFSRVPALCDRAKALGMPAIALTDHGNMAGIPELWREAERTNLKPIAGIEAYLCPDMDVHEDVEKGKRSYWHITLLAANAEGYKNLCRLNAEAFTRGFYRKPRMDLKTLAKYSSGIICLSGCVGGWPAQLALEGDEDGCRSAVAKLHTVFQKRLFVEVQYTGEPDQRISNMALIKAARAMRLPLVASGDSHYTCKADDDLHDTLFAIGIHAEKHDPARMRFKPGQYHLKSWAEMSSLGLPPESLRNTIAVADMCEKYALPRAGGLPQLSKLQSLEDLACAGLADRMPNASEEYWERLTFELETIKKLKYEDYFLIVNDYCTYARENGVFNGWGRGSSVGSLVAYALGITGLDPVKLGLYFERFINPGRHEPPDIDVDFPDTHRQHIIEYVERKYGKSCVSSITSYSTLGPKQVLIDAGKAYNKDAVSVHAVLDALPHDQQMKISTILEDPKFMKIIHDHLGDEVTNCMRRFEGIPRHASIHAAGVLIDTQPIYDRVPMLTAKGRDRLATQYVYEDLKYLGYEKFDILGVKALGVIDELSKRLQIDLAKIPLNDKKTYDMLSRGEGVAVFQYEGWGYQKFLKQFRPQNFADMMMTNALYRPGPMQGGQGLELIMKRRFKHEPLQYAHPLLEPILKETYGVAVYQEQLLQMVRVLAGWSLAEADNLRRAIAKKKADLMAEAKVKFIADCGKSHGKKLAEEVFHTIEFAGRYSWNKAHAAAYGMVSYVSAWFKANHPAHYMCVFLNSELGNHERVQDLVTECTRMGLLVSHPLINQSEPGYTVNYKEKTGFIRAGLGAVKFLGEKAVKFIVSDKEINGRYRSVEDFRSRVPKKICNITAFTSLIKARAFEGLPEKTSQEDVPF